MVATSLRFVPVILAAALLSSCVARDLARGPLAAAGPKSESFKIGGSLDVPLYPGTSGRLDLELTNPYGEDMAVTRLLAKVSAVVAPEAGPNQPCEEEDFAVDQFSGEYPLGVRASTTKSLSELGILAPQMPAVRMLNTGVNQDGCRNARLTLTYTGTAEEPR